MVFYEISPRVVDIARREFTFLKDTAARTSLVMGDGRLSLEREAPKGYDVLGIDAFSGDSIPMHLITREAMALYARHIKPDGVIVFQATNRYVDLPPVIKRLAGELGFEVVLVSDYPAEDANGPGYCGLRPTRCWSRATRRCSPRGTCRARPCPSRIARTCRRSPTRTTTCSGSSSSIFQTRK